MSDCIFCRIVAGTIPSIRICEDAHALAFMDIRPIQPGHALVIPKQHVVNVIDMEPADYDGVMRMAQRVGRAIGAEWRPPKVGMAVIGFDVAHAHVHVLPLLTMSDLTSARLLDGSLKAGAMDELKRNGEQLRARLA